MILRDLNASFAYTKIKNKKTQILFLQNYISTQPSKQSTQELTLKAKRVVLAPGKGKHEEQHVSEWTQIWADKGLCTVSSDEWWQSTGGVTIQLGRSRKKTPK